MYGFVGNNPINAWDLLGLRPTFTDPLKPFNDFLYALGSSYSNAGKKAVEDLHEGIKSIKDAIQFMSNYSEFYNAISNAHQTSYNTAINQDFSSKFSQLIHRNVPSFSITEAPKCEQKSDLGIRRSSVAHNRVWGINFNEKATINLTLSHHTLLGTFEKSKEVGEFNFDMDLKFDIAIRSLWCCYCDDNDNLNSVIAGIDIIPKSAEYNLSTSFKPYQGNTIDLSDNTHPFDVSDMPITRFEFETPCNQ